MPACIFEHAYILLERLLSNILFKMYSLPVSKKNLRKLFLSSSIPVLGSIWGMLMETFSHLTQNIGEESIYSQYFFLLQCSQPGPLFQKRTSPKKEEVSSYLWPHLPKSQWFISMGWKCVRLWQDLCLETLKWLLYYPL